MVRVSTCSTFAEGLAGGNTLYPTAICVFHTKMGSSFLLAMTLFSIAVFSIEERSWRSFSLSTGCRVLFRYAVAMLFSVEIVVFSVSFVASIICLLEVGSFL